MTRIVKAPAVRRNEILDAAFGLLTTKGYEQMAMQDIVDALQISKGTLYYYFDSKQALLQALLERMLDEVDGIVRPIVQDGALSALEKFQRFFAVLNRYRQSENPFLLHVLEIWYRDDNAMVRQKVRTMQIERARSWLVPILQQGIEEGSFTTSYPEQVAILLMSLQQGVEESIARILLSKVSADEKIRHIESTVPAYAETLERMLGAPAGSLHPLDPETLKKWLAFSQAPEENRA